MKTSINIPDDLLEEAMRRAQTATRTEAIVMALEEFVRRREVDELLAHEGAVGFWTQDEWRRFRRGKTRSR